MSKLLSNRDYHLTKFRIGKLLEKGPGNLTGDEDNELAGLIADMRIYEHENNLPTDNNTLGSLLNEYQARNAGGAED